MSEKMPKVIWLQAPIDTPETCWKGNGEITWCWHSIDENGGPDTKYLRADTCTPNEECVSKAELEKFDKWLENGRVNCLGTPLGNPNKDYDDGKAAGFSLALTMLREVMDK